MRTRKRTQKKKKNKVKSRQRGGRIFKCKDTDPFGIPPGNDARVTEEAERIMREDLRARPQPLQEATLDHYCKHREWFQNVPDLGITSNGSCDDIPLQNLYQNIDGVVYRQFVCGRMSSLLEKNYYNCQSRFRTLEVRNWSPDLNDAFIHCIHVDKEDHDFPVRIITDDHTHSYDPEIYSYGRYSPGQRLLEKRSRSLFASHDVREDSHGIDSLCPRYGAISGVLLNREICQFYKKGIRLWQCVTVPHTYLYFVSFKMNDWEYDVRIVNDVFVIEDKNTGEWYTFQDVTLQHRCDESE